MFYNFDLSSTYQINSIWNETSDDWKCCSKDWRVVGSIPFRFIKSTNTLPIKQDTNIIDINKVILSKVYCAVEFESGRIEVGYGLGKIETGTFVILEADRGEDCGKVIGEIKEENLVEMYIKLGEMGNTIEPKQILRLAFLSDLEKLRSRKAIEEKSLIRCRELVNSKDIDMEILDCEYQWDMKKITFYFKSTRRVDFRNLLRDLFKLFKIRIWMCAETRINNNIIRKYVDQRLQ